MEMAGVLAGFPVLAMCLPDLSACTLSISALRENGHRKMETVWTVETIYHLTCEENRWVHILF